MTDDAMETPPTLSAGLAIVQVGDHRIEARTLCVGRATGPTLALDLPLSFWGGVDHHGRIVDAHHPQRGACIAGTVLAMTSGRGSSSSSSVLAELIRAGYAPAGIILAQSDAIIALGALAAVELYDVHSPVVQVDQASLPLLRSGLTATVRAN